MHIHVVRSSLTNRINGVKKVSLEITKRLKNNKSLDIVKDVFLSIPNFKKVNVGKSSRFNRYYYKILATFYMARYFKRIKCFKVPQIVFYTSTRLFPFLSSNIIKIVTLHDLVFKTHPKTQTFRGFIFDSVTVPRSLKRSDIIVAVSKSTASDVERIYPQYSHKVRVMPLAGNLYATNLDQNSQKELDLLVKAQKYILCVGTIEPRKNFIRMIEAYNKLPNQLKNEFKLIFAGALGWGDIDLQKKIHELKLSDKVIIKFYVKDSELLALYKKAYCLAMPSLYEGFGLPILEAQKFGVPVITSNISSMPEVAGDGGILINPLSVASIKKALEDLLTNPSLRNELSKKAKNNASKYSWDKSTDILINIFKEAVELKKIKSGKI